MRNPIKSFKSLTFSMSFIRDLKDIKDYFSQQDEKSYKILQIPDFSMSIIKDLKDLKDFFSNEMRNPIKSFKSLTFL